MIWIVALPSAIGCGTVNVAVSREASRCNRHLGEIDLRRVQRHRRRGFRQDNVDRLASAKGFLFEVGSKPQRVVLGDDVAGKPLRAGWNRYEDEKEKYPSNSDHSFKVAEL